MLFKDSSEATVSDRKRMSIKELVLIFTSVLITALLTGVGVYYYMDTRSIKLGRQHSDQVEQLQDQIKVLEQTISSNLEESAKDTTTETETISTSTHTVKGSVYTNKQYGFTITAPTGWTIKTSGLEGASIGAVPSPLSKVSLTKGGSYFSLYVNPDGFGYECADPAVTYKASIINKRVVITDRAYNSGADPNISGGSCGYAITTSLFKSGTDSFFILASGERSNLVTDEAVFKQIVSDITFN